MHNNKSKETSYCPDHTNRQKENRTDCTLEEWIKRMYNNK